MSLLTTSIRQREGFTIVELLIVIVVIGILAAITIVAYNGIQARAKTGSQQSAAAQVAKKAEAYYSVTTSGAYPVAVANFVENSESGLSGLSVVDWTSANAAGNPNLLASYDDGKRVIYQRFTTTGGCVNWYDYAASVRRSTSFGTGGC